MRANPDTKVLAKVYQLYMVENQCASILISQSQGMVEATVSAKNTMKMSAQMELVQRNFVPSSCVMGSSDLFDNCLIFQPTKDQVPNVTSVHMKKKVGFRNPFLKFRMGSFATASLLSQ